MGGGGDGGKLLGKRSLQEAAMLLLVLSFLCKKIVVYLNTSASRSCSSPDTIKFAFSPWCFHFPFAAGAPGCRGSDLQAAAGLASRGQRGETSPGDEGLIPCVLVHLLGELLPVERLRSIRFE